MQKAPYRNAARSKKMIQDAYIRLMSKKDPVSIKTCEVIALSDVSKGTFYAHYTCLYDVQQEIENQRLVPMFRIFEEKHREDIQEDFFPLFLDGLQAMEADRELFRILFRPGCGDSFLNKVKKTFLTYMTSGNNSAAGVASHERARLTYVAGGAIALIQDWLEYSPDVPAEEMARIISDCAQNGMMGREK